MLAPSLSTTITHLSNHAPNDKLLATYAQCKKILDTSIQRIKKENDMKKMNQTISDAVNSSMSINSSNDQINSSSNINSSVHHDMQNPGRKRASFEPTITLSSSIPSVTYPLSTNTSSVNSSFAPSQQQQHPSSAHIGFGPLAIYSAKK